MTDKTVTDPALTDPAETDTAETDPVVAAAGDGRHDFDFLHGDWRIANRVLRTPLAGSDDWAEFPATGRCRPLLDGLVNTDELAVPGRTGGVTVRVFDTGTRLWSIYWITGAAALTPPVVGRFTGGRGEFYGDEEHHGTPVRVRYLWQPLAPGTARWEQAFSADGGTTWETNWTMDCVRV